MSHRLQAALHVTIAVALFGLSLEPQYDPGMVVAGVNAGLAAWHLKS